VEVLPENARVTVAALLAAAAAAMPIPQGPNPDRLPAFDGHAVAPRPLSAPIPPRHPHMAPNGRSNIHDDAYQSDTYTGLGPLATGGIDTLSALKGSECASITFDARGRLVTVCVGLAGPQLELIDPRTLETIATFELPPRLPGSGNPFTNFAGGGYFYLDDRDRAVIPTTTRHVVIVALRDTAFAQEADFDLTSAVGVTDQVISALPDFGAAAGNRSTSDRDRPDFAKNGPMSGYRIRRMGIQAIPMSEPNVSDLVFRDLDPDTPPGRAFDDAWEAALREELEKLRPVRPGPRVIPAADAGDRPPRRGR
jgi:hypothetical protein